ncbi:MAG: hypothetical protein ABWY06_11265 [Pseudomonas sp.]|uniref:hypothetical protein n=1 Tax=Pseudomonas sp. TaxID=306 RepID=UPI003398E6D6
MDALQELWDPQLKQLRERLRLAGCVFEFEVYRLPTAGAADEDLHRQALAGLFARLELERERWRQRLVARHGVADQGLPPVLRVELEQARPASLDSHAIGQLRRTHHWQKGQVPLYAAFRNPPYGTRLGEEEMATLFHDWLDLLGLRADEFVQVLDWVGEAHRDPNRSDWSNYFDDGKDWWGVWCLSIGNPARGTLSVLAASATD